MTSFKIPPSALIFLSGLAIFTIIVSVLSEGMGGGVISTSFIKTIGKHCVCALRLSRWIWFGGIVAYYPWGISPFLGWVAI